MVMSLIPQSIQIRCRFDPPTLLTADGDLAAALGLAYQYLNKPLPDKESLKEYQSDFLVDSTNRAEEKLYYLIEKYKVLGNTDTWRDMLKYSYRYKDKILK